MKTLLNSRLSPISLLPHPPPTIFRVRPPRVSFPPPQFLPFQTIDQQPCLIPRSTAVGDSTALDVPESSTRDPSISSSYRDPRLAIPNLTLLDAQGRVCTGPTQTRPLTEDQAFRVLDTILRSVKGELENEDSVSNAQMGAFFAAMTIRANAFPEATQWSEGERRAMNTFWPLLVRALPPDIIFIADPEGSLLGVGSSIGPQYTGNSNSEMRLVGALREILAGGHLGYEEVQGVLREVLPLNIGDSDCAGVSQSLLSAFLIGQRMNRETDRELKAYCLTFDDELGSAPVADVRSLTHYGEPYDGNTRYFRSTLFVAAVRSCYGESCLLHGVEWMPSKGGVTEEQMLKYMGASTCLSPFQAKDLLEDEEVGFAYISLREARPSLYSLVELREHIKKRPPLATTEKVQQFVKCIGDMLGCLSTDYSVHLTLFGPLFYHLKSTTLLAPRISLLETFPWFPATIFHACLGSFLVGKAAEGHPLNFMPKASGKEGIVAGFYHEGYEEPLLMLMKRRGVHSGLVIKGEEGALSMTTRLRAANVSKGLPVNYCAGFRSMSSTSALELDGVSRQSFNLEVNARDYGFEPTDTPRTDRSVLKNIELGLAALRGEKGPAYDRIVLNAGIVDHLLGCEGGEDISVAFERAREAIDSGTALKKLLNYIKISHKV